MADAANGSVWYHKSQEDFLLAGGADIALCSSCTYLFGNLKIVRTFFVYDMLGSTFMVPKPRPVDSSKFLYLSVDKNVWIGFIGSLIIICVTLYIFAKQ